MKRVISLCLLLAVIVLLTGCTLTVDQMYCLPKRSDDYNDLQSAIDSAMSGLAYCAPLTGENQQTVQQADLDGDGKSEYILYAKNEQEEKPLRILVFQDVNGKFQNTEFVECNGTAFDQVEYVDMNGDGGMEILVGRQLSDQLIRSVSVYTFVQKELMQLSTVSYTKYLTTDLDMDGKQDLFVLRPGQTEADHGVAELYTMDGGNIERYNEVNMSQPIDKLKRVLMGKIEGGIPAIYTANAVGETSLVTDVFILRDELLVNIGLSDGSDTSVQTLRNFYIYADDIDDDTVVELPRLITMKIPDNSPGSGDQHLVCWYAMTVDGGNVVKMYTYHNFVGGWYVQLNTQWAERTAVVSSSNEYAFYVWSEDGVSSRKILTVTALSGQNREQQASEEEYIQLHKTDTVVYVAVIEPGAEDYGLSAEVVQKSFRLIQQDWKTGET